MTRKVVQNTGPSSRFSGVGSGHETTQGPLAGVVLVSSPDYGLLQGFVFLQRCFARLFTTYKCSFAGFRVFAALVASPDWCAIKARSSD